MTAWWQDDPGMETDQRSGERATSDGSMHGDGAPGVLDPLVENDGSDGPGPFRAGVVWDGDDAAALTTEEQEAQNLAWDAHLASDARAIRKVVTWLTLAATTVFTLVQVHPELIVRNNTPTGGDMGAHVWAPAFLRDHLLPNMRLQGWSMDWYAGLPVYRFYMLPPALLMTFLNGLLQVPYGVAFKIVAVLGVVSLPISCWFFGRMARLPWPIPELMAVGGVLFCSTRTSPSTAGTSPPPWPASSRSRSRCRSRWSASAC
jgi:hypothetical protein